jgi:uncharacterized DUF497 family protein
VDAGLRITAEWDDEKADSNAAKHGVTFELAATVFADRLAATIYDPDHSEAEARWITVGRSENGSLLLVVHSAVESGPNEIEVRIISARKPTKHVLRSYQEG